MTKNYTLHTEHFPSADGRSQVAYYRFVPSGEPRAILQISHGMCEYLMRYEPLANHFIGLGYLVCGHDHTGHGASAATPDDLGYPGGSHVMVEDVEKLRALMKEQYPELPLILLGHSMGSFIARLHAAVYPGAVDALVIVGTGGPGNPTGLGKLVARLVARLRGDRHRSKLITAMAFGSYLSRIPKADRRSKNDWLSRDAEVVRAYDADPLCGYPFTAKGYYDLFDLISKVSRKSWPAALPKDLPILLMSGDADPVGAYGRGVQKVFHRLLAVGHTDVSLLLYPKMRHEIFHELGKESVREDLARWLDARNL